MGKSNIKNTINSIDEESVDLMGGGKYLNSSELSYLNLTGERLNVLKLQLENLKGQIEIKKEKGLRLEAEIKSLKLEECELHYKVNEMLKQLDLFKSERGIAIKDIIEKYKVKGSELGYNPESGKIVDDI